MRIFGVAKFTLRELRGACLDELKVTAISPIPLFVLSHAATIVALCALNLNRLRIGMETMRFQRLALSFCLLLGLGVCSSAVAHKPVVVDGGPTTLETAYVIDDPAVSQVGYHHAQPTQPALWFTFEAEAGETLYLELGVPEIEGLASLRPRMALIGEGLPEPPENATLPFELPEGHGVLVYDTADVPPELFQEHFTGTSSWKFEAERPELPTTGRYYLVGYLPPEVYGKFWMAIGTKEEFGLKDIVSLPKVVVEVRQFHEVFVIGGLAMGAFIVLTALILRGIALLTS